MTSPWPAATQRHLTRLWETLHQRYLALPPGADDSAWLAWFNDQIPCGTCRAHWLEVLYRVPPDWREPFRWSVLVHNEVNRATGAPELSYDDALRRWGGTP